MSKPTYKIFTAEVSDEVPWNKFFPFYANLWGLVVNNDYTGIADPELKLDESIGFNSSLKVGSIRVANEQYTRIDTIDELLQESSRGSYYFDNNSTLLLIHFEDSNNPYEFLEDQILIGLFDGYYQCLSQTSNIKSLDGVFNGIQYEPRLLSTPVITDKRDNLYFSRQVLSNSSIELNNADFALSFFSMGNGVRKRTGNFTRILEWSGESLDDFVYEDMNIIYQGVIQKVKHGRKVRLDLKDLRASLNFKSPFRYLDNSNFPDIKNPNKDRILPELFGEASNVPCECLNEESDQDLGPVSYQFIICDAQDRQNTSVTTEIGDITQVFVNGQPQNITPTVQYDAINLIAYFELDREVFSITDEDSNIRYENMDKVSIDVEGYKFNNAVVKDSMGVIELILLRNYGIPFNDTFYNTTVWNSFKNGITNYDVGYYLPKPVETQKQIGRLATSILGKFVYDVDLRFSFDNDDFDGIKADITKYEVTIEDYFPDPMSDSTLVLSTFRVGYNIQWNESNREKQFTWSVDSSNADNALANFGSTHEEDFETLISNDADLDNFKQRILNIGGISNDTFVIRVDWEKGKGLKSGEYVAFEADHVVQPLYGWTICQIQSISPKVDTWEWNLTLRVFEYGPYFTLITEDNQNAMITEDNKFTYIVETLGRLG